MAAVAATAFDEKVYEPVDDMDLLSARPDLCVLGYPGLSCEVQTEAFAKKVLEGKAQSVFRILKRDNYPIVLRKH